MKKGIVLALALMLAAAAPIASVQAAPADHAPAMKRGEIPGVPADKLPAVKEVLKEYRAQTKQVMSDMYTKQTELDYLSRINNIEPKMLLDRIADIRALHDKFDGIKDTFSKRLQKDFALDEDRANEILRGCSREMGRFHQGGMGGGMSGKGCCGGGDGAKHQMDGASQGSKKQHGQHEAAA